MITNALGARSTTVLTVLLVSEARHYDEIMSFYNLELQYPPTQRISTMPSRAP